MAKESAQARLAKEQADRLKSYKATEDAERAFYLLHAASLIRDYPGHAALAASFRRELDAMNARQVELDAKENEEEQKRVAAAKAEDAHLIDVPDLDSPPSKARGAAANQADVAKR
jgi:hypothetical protein